MFRNKGISLFFFNFSQRLYFGILIFQDFNFLDCDLSGFWYVRDFYIRDLKFQDFNIPDFKIRDYKPNLSMSHPPPPTKIWLLSFLGVRLLFQVKIYIYPIADGRRDRFIRLSRVFLGNHHTGDWTQHTGFAFCVVRISIIFVFD